ncbi:heterokaryon incompatibility protein [Fusarium sp. NRRL 52700]|nr:heterokaryon incompatibility protein [Fusarium sp. NRRL 52700]
MAIYKYLRRDNSQIELVRVLPPSPHDNCLSLELRHGYIGDGTYSALPYVWGDASEQKYILVNRVLFRRNLHQALTQLRSNGVVEWLWIDSLCIQQKNLDEKSYQVGLMGTIFGNAVRVYSWLGEGTPSTDIAMDFCARIGSQATMVGIDQGSGKGLGIFLSELFASRKSPSGLTRGAQDLADFFHGLLQDPGLKAQESGANQLFQGLRDMMDREYWKRIWINQEVALAKEAVVLRWPQYYATGEIDVPTTAFIEGDNQHGILRRYGCFVDEIIHVWRYHEGSCVDSTPVGRERDKARRLSSIMEFVQLPQTSGPGEDYVWRTLLYRHDHYNRYRNASEDGDDEIRSFIRAVMRQQILTVDSLTWSQVLHLNTVPAPKPQSMNWTVAEKLSNAIEYVRECVFVSEQGRTLFKTQKGMLGVGYEYIQPGDVVTLLLGCHSPIVLRPRHEGGFTFAGDAYVDGIMHGEFFQTIPTEKEFVIY